MLDGRLDEVIYQVIDKLWQQDLDADETTIGLLQLIADEKYPVYLSMKNVDNPINRKANSVTITFADLSLKLASEYEREKMEDNESVEIILKYRAYFQQLRMEVARLIDEAENRLFGKYFANKITTNFLTEFFERRLADDTTFMRAMEFVLRSYGISNRKELMKIALERVRVLSEEVPKNIWDLTEHLANLEKETHMFKTKAQVLQSAVLAKNDFPTAIVDRRKGLTFFTDALQHVFQAPKFHLLFSGLRDGFDAAKFHSLCDGKGPTLVVVETKDRRVFGGFTSKPWGTGNTYHADEHAFLFSWDWKEIYRQHQNHNKAVYHGSANGPIFGGGHDLAVSNLCQSNNSSCMVLNNTYSSHGRERDTISGGYYFTVQNYEVFLLKG
jgi:TLD